MKKFLLVFALAGAALAGDSPGYDLSEFRLLPVLEAGRKKPIDTYAREKLEFITGKATWKGQDPVETLLSMVFEPAKWETAELIKVSFPALVESIGKRKDGKLANFYSLKEILENKALVEELHQRQISDHRKNGPREKAIDELSAKIHYIQMLGPWLKIVPPPPGYPGDDWFAIEAVGTGWRVNSETRSLYPVGCLEEIERIYGELAVAVRTPDAAAAGRAMTALQQKLSTVNPEKYPPHSMLVTEAAFMRWQPFRIAWIIYAIAAILLGLRFGLDSKKFHTAGYATMCVGFAMHLVGVGMRAYVAQRAPWADLYEALVVVSLICVLFAIVFDAIYRTSYISLSASVMSGAGLVGASMLAFDFKTIDPLVPVLRSWWLKYHVLSMIASYGAFALAFGISILHLIFHFGKKDVEASKRLEDLTYHVIQVGFFFITVGVIMGAIWADSAWGRYWGWDPKEIWALVTWFIYGAYIHGRMIGWCRGIKAAGASIIGFAAVMFTFFGVNFVLTGLHSYANPS